VERDGRKKDRTEERKTERKKEKGRYGKLGNQGKVVGSKTLAETKEILQK